MNFRQLSRLLGGMNLLLSAFMLPPLGLGVIDGRGWHPFVWSIGFCLLISALPFALFRGNPADITRRQGFALVTLAWLSASVFGSLPFYFSGYFGSFTQAFFEAVSGFTTTGATILPRVSHLPRSILLWRSMIQWLGGMGIVLLTMAIMPLLGVGGVMLFKAEVPGPSVEKLRPRIRATAKLLWWVYAILTAFAACSLWFAGMDVFDAVCHAFTALATGGFSVHDAGVMGYDNAAVEWVLILFMLIAGCNFVLHYHAFRGRLLTYAGNEEFRWYIGFFLGISLAVLLSLAVGEKPVELGQQIRHALFQTASLMTTTGFHSADFEAWRLSAPAVLVLLTVAMFLGGMGGSTGGGVKTVRVVAAIKLVQNTLHQLLHPRAVTRIRLDGEPLSQNPLNIMMGFLCLHGLLFVSVATLMAMLGLDGITSVSATAACLNNIGPGFQAVGPLSNYGAIPSVGLWILAITMLIGRLELFTVIIMLTPGYWRS